MSQVIESSAHGSHQGDLSPVKVGMITFLASESAFFGTLVMVYLYNLSQGSAGEYSPANMLDLPLALPGTVCLLSSSVTVHFAVARLHRRTDCQSVLPREDAAFRLLWLATMVLGIVFLGGTAVEWRNMFADGFTIRTNLFGSAYFTLVGFHAAHVTVGIILLGLVLALTRPARDMHKHEIFAEVVSWYWHFVDGVWVVVFTVVYLLGR